ncbi:hypothetical protein [Paractinoplanes atraurantiacus]|uniref:Uncharacterized protein n=1 Tax=Paractinoplanes atraurantiacus TaxID=1036182 RepID=A0A285JMH8_9ACTN|nr:hypothetical protein [Actinoplanes atraurantiacus]SNY61007.1 hypothetical protein SAMN05421748_12260 [Actinoplanes atraurantiacus]
MMTPQDDSLVNDAFGTATVDCFDYYLQRLCDLQAWPVFPLGLAVVFCNLPGEQSTDFLLCRKGGDLAAHLLRKPAYWPHWRRENGVVVSDGRISMRDPGGRAGLPDADLIEVSSALAA